MIEADIREQQELFGYLRLPHPYLIPRFLGHELQNEKIVFC